MTIKANYEKELYKAQLEIQEQTLHNISREIHDNIGQDISLAKLGLSTLDLDRKDEAKGGIVETADILERALEELRHLSRTLNTDLVKKGGLIKSIEMQVGFLKRGGKFLAHFEVNGEPFILNDNKEIILFRILQEAINNIIRHSAATDICISLSSNKDFVILQIQDNGKGFDLTDVKSVPSKMNGVLNMQYRAKLIDAEFKIDTKIGSGTKIIVTTPY